jgi:CDP-diacylglycerol---glycerol-3-phosphate 3-phosphatidyltransferase
MKAHRIARQIPNALSLSRLALGLCFPALAVSWRLPAVAYAMLSDLADGAISRSHGPSTLGRILDPLADKVFVLAVLATMIGEGTLGLGEVSFSGSEISSFLSASSGFSSGASTTRFAK